jgi:hypothetical protein
MAKYILIFLFDYKLNLECNMFFLDSTSKKYVDSKNMSYNILESAVDSLST